MSLRTAIAAAILSLLLAACETARHDGIILEGAMLAEPDVYPLSHTSTTDGDAFLPTRGHRIVAGSDRVIGYREYSPGRLLWIDDESFEKITIQLPPDLPRDSGGLTIGDGSGFVIVYSEGGSAWPGSACFGTAVSGTVEYQRTWFGRWNVTVSLQAPLQDPTGKKCESASVSKRFRARPMHVHDLTPWLGKAGGHPYDETYPRGG